MAALDIGIIGCGNISESYFAGASRSALVRIKACADMHHPAALARAAQFGVAAMPVDQLLADPEIALVINLTIPAAHASVGRQVIDAGKHLYLEKPLAADWTDACALVAHAAERGVRIGCAPDTFLGAGPQASRRALDAGVIGQAIGGSVAILSHGMEHWHPNPAFFFKPGGGPLHDMGPYYVTQLVNLLGPVRRVTASASIGNPVRTITSAPLHGQQIEVTVPTTVNGTLEFACGANIALSASWDVWHHQRAPMELYGTEGSMVLPDPNFFGGVPQLSRRGGPWEAIDTGAHPFGADNRTLGSGRVVADYRIVGVLDMAAAIAQGRPHRASGALALHVLEVLDGLERAALEGRHVTLTTACERPAPLPHGEDESVFLFDGA
jgi:predicted dehydrogenase